METSTATRDSALAKQRQAAADTKQAAINLSYTQVKAPFDGIVTARQVSIGELVGTSGNSTVLATVVQLDPIYINFNVGEQDVLRLRAGTRGRGLTEADLKQIPIEVGLENETGYPHKGTLDYANPGVNPSTGTLAARGVLQNSDRAVAARLFRTHPRAAGAGARHAPGSGRGHRHRSGRALCPGVGKDDIVEQRKVELGQTVGDLRVIADGLKPDDRVVVSGISRAIPGQKVDPQMQTVTLTGIQP